jgi:predicted transcriptional regulator of viral defense system
MAKATTKRPDWDELYGVAAGQSGYVTTQQAAEKGFSVQLLRKHVAAGRLKRARRGIYRLVHFPAGEQDDLVEIWLWAERAGVFSHETALALQDLSDALPASVHLTLPESWQRRRLRVPTGVSLHFSEVNKADRTWIGAVPTTNPRRTIADCIEVSVQPDLIRQALEQAASRGILASAEAKVLRRRLARRMREPQ